LMFFLAGTPTTNCASLLASKPINPGFR
jgi:hypothetical protein